ncbi:hypothetical protein OUZ56_024963 [Daphnia magna]|uniref:Metallothionein n=1 Tax=Daphnia magna TaxID=35525 RepID=A0ABQ9ZIH5_9CRUS|nr:hypothetical protein OUZ56_024963 [Daphnia magna]
MPNVCCQNNCSCGNGCTCCQSKCTCGSGCKCGPNGAPCQNSACICATGGKKNDPKFEVFFLEEGGFYNDELFHHSIIHQNES